MVIITLHDGHAFNGADLSHVRRAQHAANNVDMHTHTDAQIITVKPSYVNVTAFL